MNLDVSAPFNTLVKDPEILPILIIVLLKLSAFISKLVPMPLVAVTPVRCDKDMTLTEVLFVFSCDELVIVVSLDNIFPFELYKTAFPLFTEADDAPLSKLMDSAVAETMMPYYYILLLIKFQLL